ncbi:extracellular solute-binding protein [Paenibacillus psychroresistens]|uniref:Extracellular solute-binding protein n=1 Tax=Paenibacillus psychroresistens TaxID=1778678 RepID=A0A6B8RRZ9_9BACL|nr:extracellular solute-binding protein [Paenibacillus psychroresistens]QGQ99170.1 extracellular solute-binding protein [Paenibacillus psychroresistens]
MKKKSILEKKRTMSTIMGLVLVASISLGVAGCGNKNEADNTPQASSSSDSSASPEATTKVPTPVTLKISGPTGSFAKDYPSGVQNDEVAIEIAKQTGVSLDFETHPDDQKFNIMLASGDLPDIIVTEKKYIKQLIEGNNIIPMDDLLLSNGKDIVAESQNKLDFSKKYLSNETNKVYFIQGFDGPPAKPDNYSSVAPVIRWDLYKELGYPAVNTTDDLLNVLKQMQDKHPTNEEGKKVYGLSPWIGDQAWKLWNVVTYFGYNVKGTNEGSANHLFDIDPQYNAKSLITENDSSLWTGLRFYNKANRMGILDPDSFTQKFDNAGEKGKSNRVLSSWVAWSLGGANENFVKAGHPEKGFESLPPMKGTSQYLGHYNALGQETRLYAISKNSKNPEKAMEVINFLQSSAGSELLWNGVKDVHWKLDNGKPVVLESVLQASKSDPDFEAKTGILKYTNFAGHGNGYVDKTLNTTVSFPSWSEYTRNTMSVLDKDFSEHYGVSYPGEVVEKMVEKGDAKLSAFNTIIDSLLPTAPDDIKRIDDKIMEYLVNNYPKAILEKSDEKFEAKKQEMIDDIMKMDYQKSFDFWSKAIVEAQTEAQKYN